MTEPTDSRASDETEIATVEGHEPSHGADG